MSQPAIRPYGLALLLWESGTVENRESSVAAASFVASEYGQL